MDVVVVHRLDRFSRSLADFCRLLAHFQAVGVSFVSVTQSFDTSSAMGRLTMNILMSFILLIINMGISVWVCPSDSGILTIPQKQAEEQISALPISGFRMIVRA